MAQQMYTDDRAKTYGETRRDDHPIARTLLPLLLGFILGWGANSLADNARNDNNVGGVNQQTTTP